jgi:AraC-like DNA-binding protein
MIEVIYTGSIFCALLTVYILLFKKDALRSYADYLLSAFFIFESWAVIVYLLIYSGWIANVPHFYKTAAPLNFLFPVLTYLYVRAVLYNEKGFTKNDIWHLIPFLFFIINYLPFFILPIEIKKAVVIATTKDLNQAYKYQAGIIPEYITYIIRTFQTLLYLIFQWRLIIKYNKENKNNLVQNQIKTIINWLKIFTWASTLFVVAFILLTVIAVLYNTINIQGVFNYLPGLLVSISFLVISSYLVTHPAILDGLPFIKYKEGFINGLNEQVEKIPFIVDNFTKELAQIEEFCHTHKPYLNNNFTIGQLSVILEIPIRDLSYIINQHYNMRFTDFINSLRIKYIINKINIEQLDKYTIESVALDAGFSSRSNFYKSFKKLYQTTPLEYFKMHLSVNSITE